MEEIKKRQGYNVVISKLAKSRMEKEQCPGCGKPKEDWNRRKDWRCCSVECTSKFHKMYISYGWPDIRLKVFKRDGYSCVKCKYEPNKKLVEYGIYSDADENYWRNIVEKENKIFKEFKKKVRWKTDPDKYSKYINFVVYDTSKLIGDHIKPISLGGDEWDLDNIQTLCEICNKIKTKQDIKEISIVRKRIRNKTEALNFA